jgi:hypothetical protein
MRSICWSVAACACVGLGACASTQGPAEVDVRRADTHEPVAGAEVVAQIGTKDGTFCGDEGRTDARGVVRLDRTPIDRDLLLTIGHDRTIYLTDRVAHPRLGGAIHWTMIPECRIEKRPEDPAAPALEFRVISPR